MKSLNLRGGTRPTALALAAAACLGAPLASAQAPAQNAAKAEETTEIVITGSRIRGAAPVGATVTSVGRADIESAGAVNTTQILLQVPQIFNLGISENSRGQSGGNTNITYAAGINLRGIGPFATLVLVNGHRSVAQGTQGLAVDPSIIPSLMIERVEVVADGASAIYGSDAIAGVANLILRRNEPGAQAMMRFGVGDQYRERQLGALLGRQWGGGQFTLAAEHTYRSALNGRDRDFYNGNLLAQGGGDFRSTQCAPGNIVIAGVSYAIPAGGVTAANASALQPNTANKCDNLKLQDLIPEQERNTLAFTFNHRLSPTVSLHGDGLLTRRDYALRMGASASSLTVPSTNAFYVRPPGAPAGGSQTVNYSFINELPVNVNEGHSTTAQGTLGVDVELGSGWKAGALYTYGQNEDLSEARRGLNNTAIRNALASSNPALALNPFGSAPTAPAVLAAISNQIALSPGRTDFQNLVLKADGPLLRLPAGPLRAAVGLESQRIETVGGQTVGPADAPVKGEVELARSVNSAYAELLVPVVGAANATTGLRRLDLSAALRYDHYSDVGSTTNPKLGLNWSPVDGLQLRGSYGTSFRAPGLVQIQPFTGGGRGGLFVQNYSDPTIGGALRVGVARQGINPDLKPETAKTRTLGLDWDLPLPAKTRLSLTWFEVVYENQIVSYLSDLALLNREGQFAGSDVIQRNPPADLVAQLIAQHPVTGVLPGTWTLLVDGRAKNLGKSRSQGVDFQLNSRLRTADAGDFTLGLNGTVFTKYQVALTPASAPTDQLNRIFNPMRFKARASVGWNRGPWAASLVVNHVNRYENNLANPVQTVGAYTTVDTRVALALDSLGSAGLLRDATLALGVSNLFDKAPPFVNIAQSANGGGGFDPTQSNPVGRVISITLDKRF